MALSGVPRLKLAKATGAGKDVKLVGGSLGQSALDKMISPKLKTGLGSRSAQGKINNQLQSSKVVMKNY